MIGVLIFYSIPFVSLAQQNPKSGERICQEKKGIYIHQKGKEGCFDPLRGTVNGGISTADGHVWNPNRKDFDLLSGREIRFYNNRNTKDVGLFDEFSQLTVCNYAVKTLAVRWSSMDVLKPPTKAEASIESGVCKTHGTHMFSLYPDIEKVKPFWRTSRPSVKGRSPPQNKLGSTRK